VKASFSCEAAFFLSARASKRELRRRMLGKRLTESPGHLILAAALAQYDGDVNRSVSLLRRALSMASASDREFVVDLLAPMHIMKRDTESLHEILSAAPKNPALTSSYLALRAVLAAIEGNLSAYRVRAAAAEASLLDCVDALGRARTLQRLGLAAYYASDADVAAATSLESAQAFEGLGIHRAAAAAYSVAYIVNLSVLGDSEQAYALAARAAEAAAQTGDESFETGAMVAQYELAAEFADDETVTRLRRALLRRSLPNQYEERFARAIADLLFVGWSGDFRAFRAAVVMVGEAATRSRPQRALCHGLRSLAEASLNERVGARRYSRLALGASEGRTRSDETFHDRRYIRLARALAASACLIIGDVVRGRRALEAMTLRNSPEGSLADAWESFSWEAAPRHVRGYARLIHVARTTALRHVSGKLTPQEREVLAYLAAGTSAPELARQTGRSIHTIRAHTRAIISKLQVHTRNAAISRARELGILT
jgi:DNA-binding CsgD family transcriptional regulator